MIQVMLDTNICVELLRNRNAKVFDHLQQYKIGEVGISVITLAELEHGVEKSARPEQNRIALVQFCAPLEILPFDDYAAVAYGQVRNALEKKGNIIGAMDMLIAAHALTLNVTLITNNLREFKRVEGLRVENWI